MKNLKIYDLNIKNSIEMANKEYNQKVDVLFETAGFIIELAIISGCCFIPFVVSTMTIPGILACLTGFVVIKTKKIKENIKAEREKFYRDKGKAIDQINDLRLALQRENVYTSIRDICDAEIIKTKDKENYSLLYRFQDKDNNLVYLEEEKEETFLLEDEDHKMLQKKIGVR